MANSDKNIVITPNISSSSADPKIVFSGADASTGPQNITLQVYPTTSGTLSFEGSAGQLFSIGNTMSGTIFSVNDVSGIPSLEVLDTGLVKLNQYNGDTNIGGIIGSSSGTRLTVKGFSNTWDGTTPGTTKGTVHLDIYGSSGSQDGAAITFSAKDSTNPAQAGIYVTSSGSYGTRMYLATTDSYATGSKTGLSISETGVVNFPRARPTYAGYTILDTNNIGSQTAGSANALNTSNDFQVNSLSAGGARIGQAGLTVNGTTGNNDSQLIMKKPSQSTWAYLVWDDAVYQSFNIYYQDGSWTHSGPSNNNSLFLISSSGAGWYASNNGTGSWNIASNATMWNQSGQWAGQVVGSTVAKMLVFGR